MKVQIVSVEGAIDIHVHTGPSLFSRIADDIDIARHSRSVNLGGFVPKCHYESTVSRALYASKVVPGIHVLGGIVLNYFVGGINPSAAEATLRQGGKIVWMPTMDSAGHAAAYGGARTYGRKSMEMEPEHQAIKGISILSEDGNLTEETKEVVKLVKEYDCILGTCHLSKEEIGKLFQFSKDVGLKKFLINHAFFKVPKFTLDELKPYVREGAFVEFCYATIDPMNAIVSLDTVAHALGELGPNQCVIASDSGQPFRPMPAESFRIFGQMLHEKGVPIEDLRILMMENPKKLLDI